MARQAVSGRAFHGYLGTVCNTRHPRGSVGGVVGFCDPVVEVGVGGSDIQIVGQAGFAFNLQSTGLDFAILYLAATAVTQMGRVWVECRYVGLAQIKRRDGDKAVAPRRLVFDADFVLLAFRRLKERAAIERARLRLERLRIAYIRCEPIIEQVDQAQTSCKCFAGLRAFGFSAGA